jgi:adhesin transport system outer membrane protein
MWLPKVDVVAKAGGYASEYTRQERFEVSAVLTQPLYDGGRGGYEQKRQRARVASARFRVSDTANAIALRVVQAYIELQRSNADFAAARKNLVALQRIASMVNRRARAGRGDRAETAQAAARVAAAKAALAEARQKVADAKALYITVVGRKPGKLSTYAVPRNMIPRSLSAAVRAARSDAPKIAALKNDAKAAKAAIGSARANVMPRFDLELSGNYANKLKNTAREDLHGKALVVMKWNVFNGGINQARVREATYRASEARSMTFATGLNLERELRLAWNAMRATAERSRHLRSQRTANRRSLAVQKRQFEAGRRTLLDILDTQNEIFVSDTALNNELYSSRFYSWKVLAITGRLLPALNLASR